MDMWMIIVLLGVVIIVYASMLPKLSVRQDDQDDFLASIGDTLQQFVDEMEEENKELLQMMKDMKKEHERKTKALMARIEELEKQTREVQGKLHQPQAAEVTQPLPSEALKTAAAAQTPFEALTSKEQEHDTIPEAPPASRFANSVKSRYKELFDLYESGKSMEYIAKKLGKNKGEVQLIIGLAKQEEPAHGRS